MTLKKFCYISVISLIGLIAGYTGGMGLVFSFSGMWTDEPALITGYAITFLITGFLFYLIIKKEWLESWKG